MKLKILDSGSQGNCAIIKDTQCNQLIIDCGIKYEKIAVEINWDKPIYCLVSHTHSDHGLSIDKLKQCGITVYSHPDFSQGKVINIDNAWVIVTLELPHDQTTTSYSFLIYNTIEKKSIYFATDCTELPRIADKPYDLIMCETNYDEETSRIQNVDNSNLGYLRHLSVEYVAAWLKCRQNHPKIFVASHLSNSGNISLKTLNTTLDGLCDKLFVAKKNLEINF